MPAPSAFSATTFGLLLGTVRAKTESLWGCLAMHSLLNLVATVQTELCLRDIWVR